MSINKMSESFLKAFGQPDLKNSFNAIKLFENDLIENPNNISSMNNIAVIKINIGIIENNIEYLNEAKELIEKSISIAKKENFSFPIADLNLNWINKILEK